MKCPVKPLKDDGGGGYRKREGGRGEGGRERGREREKKKQGGEDGVEMLYTDAGG